MVWMPTSARTHATDVFVWVRFADWLVRSHLCVSLCTYSGKKKAAQQKGKKPAAPAKKEQPKAAAPAPAPAPAPPKTSQNPTTPTRQEVLAPETLLKKRRVQKKQQANRAAQLLKKRQVGCSGG
jgi:hypothetical protein